MECKPNHETKDSQNTRMTHGITKLISAPTSWVEADTVTLSGSDGSSLDVPLDSWGNMEETQPVIGSKVQLLDE
jgi:hypothetical protein